MQTSINSFLFKQIDNSPLVVFRIIFGLLCLLESWGAILTGWVKRVFIDSSFTFTFIGFEWLQPLPGNGMYFYYIVMGVFGLFIMLGYKYRYSAAAFFFMWTATYLMQKSSYNNHYYLLCLISGIMIFMPANRAISLDVKLNPKLLKSHVDNLSSAFIIALLFVVYTYASIAKLYPDWLSTKAVSILMKSKSDYFLVGPLLQQKWLHYFLSYGGILFDGLVVPLLLIKKTRKYVFAIAIFFHLFNSFVLQIGIFPYLALAFCVFFFPPKTIHHIFLRKRKEFYDKNEVIIPKNRTIILGFVSCFLIIQAILPIRHHFIEGPVLWTEEGHRMSWRMMLRFKYGRTTFYIEDKTSGKKRMVNLKNHLTPKQIRSLSYKPDFMWQFAQKLKQNYAAENQDIRVFVKSKVSMNGSKYYPFTDEKVDIANTEWNYFSHTPWILPFNPTEK